MAAPKNLTPAQRALRAKIASLKSWENTSDPSKRTENGRKAFLRRFEDEVDPDGTLPEAERQRRAGYAMKAYFTKLAFEASKAKTRKKAGKS
jgi:hypothetical protein